MPQRDTDTQEKPQDGSPRDRASTLAEATLEISASLDPETVVRKVVEEARILTGARLGIIATIDESGPRGVLLLGAHTRGAARTPRLAARPAALRAPPRVTGAAAPGGLRGLRPGTRSDAAAELPGAFPGHADASPGREHRLLLPRGESGGGAFTDADEEVLVLFASQAAAAIANARAQESRGPDRDLAGGRRGLRPRQWANGVVQPGGAANRREPSHAGTPAGGAARGRRVPPR